MKKAERSKSDPRRFLPHEDYQDMVWMEGDVVKAASTSRRSAIPPAPVCRWRAVHPQSYLTSPLPSPPLPPLSDSSQHHPWPVVSQL